jgi:hypothetical protein
LGLYNYQVEIIYPIQNTSSAKQCLAASAVLSIVQVLYLIYNYSWIVEETKRRGKQIEEHLVNYILYINDILVKVKLMELIELKVGARSMGWLWREHGYKVLH